MALPPIRAPEYGDMSKLGSLRVTNNPASDVQRVVAPGGGRPTKMPKPEDIAATAASGAPQVGGLPQAQAALVYELARRQAVAERMMRIASLPEAGPSTKAYARAAVIAWRRFFEQVRNNTPFYSDLMG